MQQFLKINEVAELLRCSVATIRRRLAEARRGECRFPLPITKPYGHALWRSDEILDYTENQSIPSKRETSKERILRRRAEVAGLARHGIVVTDK
ncbi:MAG: helix-turn-helix domain-containing protein [Planctomycetaceae bacterium]|jgi:predicted DNA-binding transcriptional regulator AlpA|nr:helix-turn-helix domain-containing protein [Planctomycetaceae bacterium]